MPFKQSVWQIWRRVSELSVVRGHHVYKGVWRPRLGEELETQRELDNEYYCFATCPEKSGQTVATCPEKYQEFRGTFLIEGPTGSAARSLTKDSALRRALKFRASPCSLESHPTSTN